MSNTNENKKGRIEQAPLLRLLVASENVMRIAKLQYLDELDLSMHEWRLLSAIGDHGVISPTAAGTYMSIHKVRVSRAADVLTRRKLVKRARDGYDGRAVQLSLTAKGRKIYDDAQAVIAEMCSNALGALSNVEVAQLQKLLTKVIDSTQPSVKESSTDLREK
jgi:DNA-binding MarR family transcriptional regulator